MISFDTCGDGFKQHLELEKSCEKDEAMSHVVTIEFIIKKKRRVYYNDLKFKSSSMLTFGFINVA